VHQEELLSALAEILQAHPQGMSEFELLKILQDPPYTLFDKEALRDPLLMFQCHFVLFNALYLLRDRWLLEQHLCLEMVLTAIKMLPYQGGQAGLVKRDPLREYYLDWGNFTDTNQQDVVDLIDGFWKQIQGLSTKATIPSADLVKAYDTLLLDPDADIAQIKRQYHKLLHRVHPDKGGDTVHSQQIEHAYRLLKSINK
jgi:hypothetical protein